MDATPEPRCTVLMPVYNGERYLAEAVQSILDQTFHDFRLLIIDDGSTDRSLELARSFTDARITLACNETNQGVAATLNRGLASIQTDYIARMDADDIALPDRLERQIAFMDGHPDIGLCGGYHQKFFPDDITGHTIMMRHALTHDEIRFRLLFQCTFGHSTIVLRRAVLQQHRLTYSTDHPYAEDYELWTRLVQCTRMANIPCLLVRYRVHAASSSQRFRQQQSQSCRWIRFQYAATLGLNIRVDDRAVYDPLLDRMFEGSLPELRAAGRLLGELHRAGVGQMGQSRHLVLRWLNRYWYPACAQSASAGLAAWWIYCSQPFGWAVYPSRTAKLLYRCLTKHSYAHSSR